MLGWLAPLAVAAGHAAGDSRADGGTPAPYASSPRVPESPSPAPWQVVPAPRRPASPFAVTPALVSPSEDTGTQRTPKSTRPAVTFGDPGGSILHPKVPSPHRGRSHPGDPGGSITPKVSVRAVVVWGHWLGSRAGAERVPPARSCLLASVSGWGGQSTAQQPEPGQQAKRFGFITLIF